MSKKNTRKRTVAKFCKKAAKDREVVEILNLFVDVLPERERRVLRLWFWENKNLYEISKIERVRMNTAEKILESGLKRLKQKKRLILNNFN